MFFFRFLSFFFVFLFWSVRVRDPTASARQVRPRRVHGPGGFEQFGINFSLAGHDFGYSFNLTVTSPRREGGKTAKGGGGGVGVGRRAARQPGGLSLTHTGTLVMFSTSRDDQM